MHRQLITGDHNDYLISTTLNHVTNNNCQCLRTVKGYGYISFIDLKYLYNKVTCSLSSSNHIIDNYDYLVGNVAATDKEQLPSTGIPFEGC